MKLWIKMSLDGPEIKRDV